MAFKIGAENLSFSLCAYTTSILLSHLPNPVLIYLHDLQLKAFYNYLIKNYLELKDKAVNNLSVEITCLKKGAFQNYLLIVTQNNSMFISVVITV